MPETYAYIPGTCNLGKAEIRRRWRNGIIGLIVFVVSVAIIEVMHLPSLWKWMTIIPIFYSISGFIQGSQKFCYLYALKGISSTEGSRIWKRVRVPDQLLLDRRKAVWMIAFILLISLLLTTLYVFMEG